MNWVDLWQPLLIWGTAFSVVALVITAVAVPWVITSLPVDYFLRENRVVWRQSSGAPGMALFWIIAKNMLGSLLVVLGIVMLVTPGQGMLTLLVGLLLMNFPGKYKVERWLVSQPGVMRALNWLRRRRHKSPFRSPQAESALLEKMD